MNESERPAAESNEALKSSETDDQPIDAATLLRGRRRVLIEHDGETYQLLLTRNNKLMLQK
jgi:hemin uptake protein HemP